MVESREMVAFCVRFSPFTRRERERESGQDIDAKRGAVCERDYRPRCIAGTVVMPVFSACQLACEKIRKSGKRLLWSFSSVPWAAQDAIMRAFMSDARGGIGRTDEN